MSTSGEWLELPERKETLARWQARGGRVAAVLPVHAPRALLRAFDVLPMELWGVPGFDGPESDAHLQAYTCSVVRSSLGFLTSPAASGVDLFVIPHCCDSAQGLGSVLLDLVRPTRPVLPFYLPRSHGSAALQFTINELKKMADRLRVITGVTPSQDELAGAVLREEAADARLGEWLRARPALAVSNRDFYRLARAREYLPAEEFIEQVDRALKQAPRANGQRGIPTLLSGIVPEPSQVLEELDRLGAVVVADDLACTGRRLYPAGEGADPLERLARTLLGGPPDSTRGASIPERAAHLVDLARAVGARMAVFFEVKFCEPEQFYLPALRQALEEEGIRSVALELHPTEPLPHQAITRIEALVETLP